MSTGMSARMATMQMRIRRNKHHQPMMDQRRLWGTEGIIGDVDGGVGKRLPPLHTHRFECVGDWVRVIAALHHAIDKVEKPLLDGTRHHDPHRPHKKYLPISFVPLCLVSYF
jgi:hypothetical protein